MGLGMLTKSRMSIMPKRIKHMDQLKAILDKAKTLELTLMNEYIFYPGCSMEGSGKAYYDSLNAIKSMLDMELHEIDDWNCCGATEYVGINLIPAYSLIARNLALAADQANGNRTVMAPCSACYLNLEKADYYMAERPALGEKVNEALAAGGLHYDPGSLEIRHLLDVIVNDVGLDTSQSRKLRRPLNGLRVAPYLGCMVPRPDYEHRWSDHEHPTELDDLTESPRRRCDRFPAQDRMLRRSHDPDRTGNRL